MYNINKTKEFNIDQSARYFEDNQSLNIENGYFVLTMFPSLKCELNCPHCYLSKEQRASEEFLGEDLFKEMIIKVKDFYIKKGVVEPTIVFYWYGGEPTSFPLEKYKKLIKLQKEIFPSKWKIKNQFLTNLFDIKKDWLKFFKDECNSYFQTSYDYHMRSKSYHKKHIKNVKLVSKMGYRIALINVFNNTMLNKEEIIYNEVKEMNAGEIGFLPFMKNYANLANDGDQYKKWYANMSEFSNFLINFTKLHIQDIKNGTHKFTIGNIAHIFKNLQSKNEFDNIAGQTMFFLEDGQFCLPDYINNYQNKTDIEFQDVEYLNMFETIKGNTFEQVLKSENRRKYLNRQITLNEDEKCKNCEYSKICSMEFWKSSNLDNSGECPGNKRFIDFLTKKLSKEDFDILKNIYKQENINLT